jgi:hypothetical protein
MKNCKVRWLLFYNIIYTLETCIRTDDVSVTGFGSGILLSGADYCF